MFFDSYIYEVQMNILQGFPLLNVLRSMLLIFWLIYASYKFQRLEKSILAYFFVMALYLLSSSIFSNDNSQLNYYLSNFLFGFLIYWSVCICYSESSAENINKIIFVFASIFFGLSLFIEFFDVERFRASTDSLWQCGLSWNIRMCGATNNPNILGFIAFIFMAIATIFHEDREMKKSLLLSIYSIILAFMSVSRTAIFVITILLIVYSIFSNYKFLVFWVVVSLLFFSYIVVTSSGSEILGGRFSIESILSGSGRSEIFTSAFSYINDNPILGSGLNFDREYEFNGNVWNSFLDNAYLNVFVSYGLFGLVVFLGLICFILLRSGKYSKANVSIIICLCLILLFEDFSFKGYYIWLIFALLFRPQVNSNMNRVMSKHS